MPTNVKGTFQVSNQFKVQVNMSLISFHLYSELQIRCVVGGLKFNVCFFQASMIKRKEAMKVTVYTIITDYEINLEKKQMNT